MSSTRITGEKTEEEQVGYQGVVVVLPEPHAENLLVPGCVAAARRDDP